MTNLCAFVLIFTAGIGAASFVWLLWLHYDDTQNCEMCGCGMIACALGWRCPDCQHFVEAE